MFIQLPASWQPILEDEFQKPYFSVLVAAIEKEYAEASCFPPKTEIFAALSQCTFDAVKVVIIGQDPYHGANQANGLCFSVNDGQPIPPSLINIFKELKRDLGIPIPIWGNLERWASQGILLLNATLTVRKGEAESHQKLGWETFTDALIQKLATQKKGLVFLLWGGAAQKKGRQIDRSLHLVLECGHPSPLSANRGFWFDNKHFSQTNAYLEEKGVEPIQW